MYTATTAQNCGTKLFFFGTPTDLTVMGLYLCAHQQEPEKEAGATTQYSACMCLARSRNFKRGGGGGPAGFFWKKKGYV